MANTEPNITSTGGPTDFDASLLLPDADQDKYDKALEAAFGPQGNMVRGDGDKGGVGTEGTDTDTTLTPDPDEQNNEGDNQGAVNTGSSTGASGGDEEEGGEGTAATGAIGGDADFATLFRNRYNRDPQPGELEGYIQLAEWAAGLTPEQQVAINNAYADPGRYLNQGNGQQNNQNNQQVTPPVDTGPDPLEEEYGADHPLLIRLRALEEKQQSITQSTQQVQQERIIKQIDEGVTTFKSRYTDVSDLELQSLQGAVTNSGVFPGFVQAHGGDVTKAMDAAMDYAYWQNTTFRQRELQKQYTQLEEQKKVEATRKAKASSVSGASGNGASRTTPPPKTTGDRWAAVTQELSQAMNNGQQE